MAGGYTRIKWYVYVRARDTKVRDVDQKGIMYGNVVTREERQGALICRKGREEDCMRSGESKIVLMLRIKEGRGEPRSRVLHPFSLTTALVISTHY